MMKVTLTALYNLVAEWSAWRSGQSDFPKGCSQAELALLAWFEASKG